MQNSFNTNICHYRPHFNNLLISIILAKQFIHIHHYWIAANKLSETNNDSTWQRLDSQSIYMYTEWSFALSKEYKNTLSQFQFPVKTVQDKCQFYEFLLQTVYMTTTCRYRLLKSRLKTETFRSNFAILQLVQFYALYDKHQQPCGLY